MVTESHPLLTPHTSSSSQRASFSELVVRFWPLGFVAFGGPQAHIALAQQRFVTTSNWISEKVFIEIFALGSALPGPTSTQLITGIGAVKGGGWWPALLAFSLFQLPGFVALTLLGLAVRSGYDSASNGTSWVLTFLSKLAAGLVAAAFSQVLLASYSISVKTCKTERFCWLINLISTSVSLLISAQSSSWVFPLLMLCGGIATYVERSLMSIEIEDIDDSDDPDEHAEADQAFNVISTPLGITLIGVFVLITVAIMVVNSIPMYKETMGNVVLDLGNSFWRMGGTVFGGGQVVIPMIYNEVVAKGIVSEAIFLYGFALVQCLPGPFFNLATFIGAAAAGFPGALISTLGIFVPGLLLIVGVFPFWHNLRSQRSVKNALVGVNAAAAGLINAAIFLFLEKAITGKITFGICVAAGVASVVFKVPAPVVILMGGAVGYALELAGFKV